MVCLVLVIVLSLAASTRAFALESRGYASSLALLARQTSGPLDPSTLPSQCQPSCTPIFGVLNTCTDATCLCTNTNGQNLENCMDCLIGVSGAAQGGAQTVIDDFNNECAQSGANVTPLSLLPGGTSAGTTSTSVVSATRTVAASTATATATGTGKITQSSVFFSLPSTASGGAATGTGTSGSGSNPFTNGGPVGGKHLGVGGVLGVFAVGLVSAVAVLVV